MIKAALITICILIFTLVFLPFLTHKIVEGGVSGYYRAKRMWEKPHDENNSDIKE